MKKTAIIGICLLTMCAVMGFGTACSCSVDSTGIYNAPPGVVKATGPVDDDGDAERIQLNNDGSNKTANITLEETAGQDVVVNRVDWILYDADGDQLAAGAQTFIPPLEVEGGQFHAVHESVAACHVVDAGLVVDVPGEGCQVVPDGDRIVALTVCFPRHLQISGEVPVQEIPRVGVRRIDLRRRQ